MSVSVCVCVFSSAFFPQCGRVQFKFLAEKPAKEKDEPVLACFECADVLLKIRPNLKLAKIAVLWAKAADQRVQDPELKADYAKAVVNKAAQPPRLPCDPSTLVAEDRAYGYRIFREKGLVSAEEYVDLVTRLPDDVDLQPAKVPWAKPGQTQDMYLVELKGIPCLG